MPGSKKQFNKEEVKKWYASFLTKLEEAGIDLTNTASLMRVKTFDFESKDEKYIGNHAGDAGERRFAFIPKKFNSLTGDSLGYETSQPIEGDEYSQDEVDMKLTAAMNEYNEKLNVMNNLADAYKKKDSEKIIKLEANLKKAHEKQEEAFADFREEYVKTFSGYLKWMLGGQKLFDVEADYEQVEELYAKALEGNLYINFPDKNVEDMWQAVVAEDGTAEYAKNGADSSVPERSAFRMSQIIQEVKNNLEDGYNVEERNRVKTALEHYEAKIGHPICEDANNILGMFEKKKPTPVKKPGAWAWFKRIITFNQVKDDFIKYENYQSERVAYETAKINHEQKTREEYNAILDFIESEKETLGIKGVDNIKNAAVVEDNRTRMHMCEYSLRVADPSKGQFSDAYYRIQHRAEFFLMNQFNDTKNTVYQDGSFNKESMKAYWKEKGYIVPPVENKDRLKVTNKYISAKTEFNKFVAEEIEKNPDAKALYKEIIAKKNGKEIENNILQNENIQKKNEEPEKDIIINI